MKYILCLIVVVICLSFIPTYKHTYVRAKTIDDLFSEIAFKYNISESLMRKIVKCESSYNPNAQNITSKESSFGLVQINIKAHTTITKEQATDPEFALEFLAKNIKNGRYPQMWFNCSRKI